MKAKHVAIGASVIGAAVLAYYLFRPETPEELAARTRALPYTNTVEKAAHIQARDDREKEITRKELGISS